MADDDEDEGASLRAALRRLLNPLDVMLITRDRMQDALDDAVRRGRMTRDDATELLSDLMRRGRRQTEEMLEGALTAPVGRARRAAGLADPFPIEGYDDLTAAEVIERLRDLDVGAIRRVRDYERRNANRKTVLGAADSELGQPATGGAAPRSRRSGARRAARDGRWTPCHPQTRCPRPPPPARLAATSSSSPSTRSPTAATAWRGVTATSCSWPAPSPATACGPSSARQRRPTRRRAPWTSCPPRPTGCRRRRTTPARPGRCSRTSASWRSRPSRWRTRCGGLGAWPGPRSSRSSPPRAPGATATSSSTPSAPART